ECAPRSSERISSISTAPRIVSISTVARIEPFGMPTYFCEKTKTSFQSRASRRDSIFGGSKYWPVPRAMRVEVRPHLGEIKVRAGAARHQLLGVVEEVEREVEERGADRLAVDGDVLL